MKRVFFAVALLATLVFSFTPAVSAAPGSHFSDVDRDYWAAKQILSLADHGIIRGGEDGRFRPSDGLRRGELAKLLSEAFQLKQATGSISFNDLSSDHWAASFITRTIGATWMNGFPDETFRPDDATTRAQVAKILVQAKGYSIASIGTNSFTDVASAHWGQPYIEAAAKNYMITGYPDGTFRPNAPITRAEAAALIYRSLVGKDFVTHTSTLNEITYERHRRFQNSGPFSIHVLKIPKYASAATNLGLSRDRFLGLERLSSLAKRKNAIAGINADFFSSDRTSGCSGLLVDGQILSSPINERSHFGFSSDRSAFIDRARLDASLAFETTSGVEKTGVISWVNKARDMVPSKDTIVAYTPFYGPSTLTNSNGTEVELRVDKTVTPGSEIIGTVVDVRYGTGNKAIPLNSIVLSGIGSGKTFLTNNIWIGATVRLNFNLKPSWRDETKAIGGGPRIMRDGRVSVENEGFESNIVSKRHPRTAIGIDSQGNLIVLVVDGRMSFYSVGMTLAELAEEIKYHGAVDAMNLDGGGSSTLYFNGAVRNYPNEGKGERAINNALLWY